MALEDNITALIEAIKENTAEVKNLAALRGTTAAELKEEAAPKPRATKAKDEAKVEAKTEAPKAEPVKDESALYAGIPEKIAEFVGGSDRVEERDARKAKLKKLLRHAAIVKPEKADDLEQFDAMDIRTDAIELFNEQIQILIDAGDITAPPAAGKKALEL